MIGDNLLQEFARPERSEPSLSNSLTEQTDRQFAISVIVPTRNEARNIELLLSRITQATRGIKTEVIFVDDSNDTTAQVISHLCDHSSVQVVLIARPPERRRDGLGGAVVEGLKAAHAPWACVMDADLQHPPELIPQILNHAKAAKVDIVVGSRLAKGGDASSLGFKRTLISRAFAMVTRTAFPVRLRKVTDPLSGFFIVRRAAVNLDSLHPDGFKIVLEILIRCPDLRVSEIPIHFGYRHAGESKASLWETIRFFRLLLRLRLASAQNFARFLAVGTSGLVVNNLALAALTELMGIHYLLSVAVATQVSTLWNFSLTETWVFSQRRTEHPILNRLVSFLLMNNLLLILRGPLLAFMVERLGVHYIISNLASLCAITLLRYIVADRWIWIETLPSKSSRSRNLFRRPIPMNHTNQHTNTASDIVSAQAGHLTFCYNIHDILQVASMFQLPELEYFRVPDLTGEPDIRLRLERRRRERRRKDNRSPHHISGDKRRSSQRRFGNNIHYDEGLGRLGFEVTIAYKDRVEVAVSPILRLSLHVLYTNVIEPILRWMLVRKGYALVHAACISAGGRAVLVTARTDTGKTSTILRAVENYACSFLSDDMTIVSREGEVMSYPKPLTISNHTLNAVNGGSSLSLPQRLALQLQSRLHSKSGRHVGLKLSKTKLPAATMNTIVQMLIPPPKYMVHQLIPQAKYADAATLSHAVIIERGPEFEEALRHDQAVEVFVRNAEDAYGFPPYPILATSLSTWNEQDLHPQEQAIVAEALKEIPTIRLSDPKFNWWQRLPLMSANFSTTERPAIAAAD